MLGGKCSVKSNFKDFKEVGKRQNVFSGLPHAIYLPMETEFELTALDNDTEFAYCWVPATEKHPASVVSEKDIEPEVRGGHSASREIHTIIPPGYNCQRIVSCEAITPSGNWSSYPPHKHDSVKTDSNGKVVEAQLEEIYFFKFDRPEGFAFQRVYNDERTLDEAIVAEHNDIVLVPEGYHPVSTAYGYNCYYLNFLAGSHQSLACTDDPAHAWTKETWDKKDPRLPMVAERSWLFLK